jgi:uncharacterized membrane protein YqaE (UPF0057 family)
MEITLILFYLAPTMAAALNKHHNTSAIAITNILLGWTVLGWVIALIWAFTKPGKSA